MAQGGGCKNLQDLSRRWFYNCEAAHQNMPGLQRDGEGTMTTKAKLLWTAFVIAPPAVAAFVVWLAGVWK